MAYLGARKRTTRQASSQAVNRRRSEGGPRAWFASIDWNSVRFRTVAVLFFVVWGALWVRAGYVQLWEGPFLAERARRQHMAAETVAMPRGMITDRNGHILARSVECCSVYANPSIITDIEATATTLAGVLGRPVDQIKPLLEKKRSFVWLARRVDDATAEAIRQADLTGVELSREFERIYPYRQVAGQLLGFVGMDGKGLEGIERSFDEQLGGLSVRQAVRRDASGREFYVNSNYEAQPAEDVHLTLDLQVQSIAEEEISKAVTEFGAKWGGVIEAPVFKSVTSRVMAYHGSLPDPGALTPAQIKAQEKAEARARARAVRRGSKEKTVLGEYRSELATKKTALPVRDSGTVPDVVGQSVRRAVEMFARQGLVPVIKGNGSRVVRQTPEPGVRWAGKDSAPTSCVLWLSEQE